MPSSRFPSADPFNYLEKQQSVRIDRKALPSHLFAVVQIASVKENNGRQIIPADHRGRHRLVGRGGHLPLVLLGRRRLYRRRSAAAAEEEKGTE